MLAPMQPELQPIVRRLGLTIGSKGDGSLYRGTTSDGVEVVAMLTKIGMANATDAARRMLGNEVDHVIVVGIAGGVDMSALQIGDVIVPERVVGRVMKRSFRPNFVGDIEPHGTLSCGDDLITDPDALALMAAEGIVAVDMETAAVAAVCEDANVTWSVFRGISDFAGEGIIDDALFALTNPDGTADVARVAEYLEAHPERLDVLKRLAEDTRCATEGAAEAAIAACAAL
jgi:adenosylhomocysteine nucleosidase